MVFDSLYLNKDHLNGFDNYKVSVNLLKFHTYLIILILSYLLILYFSSDRYLLIWYNHNYIEWSIANN